MKKILIHTIFLLIGLNLSAQSNLTLNTVRTSGGTETACQSIVLKPGFSFVSATGKSLTLTVNPSTCDPYVGATSSLSNDHNYIQTKTYTTADGSRYMEAIQYFDGLGRPVQTVQRGITPNAADLVALQEYDAFGRESNGWLLAVAAGNNGAYMPFASYKAQAMTTYANDSAYSRPVYEASPLNRVLEQYGPGKEWYADKRAVKTEYQTNTAGGELSCALFRADTDASLTLTQTGNYGVGQLYVTKITDEDQNISYEFKDKLGQVILTRQIESAKQYDTYYIYDDYGNLKAVLPPLASDTVKTNSAQLHNNSYMRSNLAYLYMYDNRNRCISKKLPGCDWVRYVYDKADRLIFTQDGEQRKKNEWTFTIPDDFGRVVLTGTCTTVNNAAIKSGRFDDYLIKAEFSTTGTYHGYNVKVGQSTFNELTIQNPVVHTASYYDSYKFRALSGFSADNISYKTSGEPAIYHTRYGTDASTYEHKGLLTGTATLLLDGSTATKYLYTGMYYDNKKQLIQSHSTHHLGGVDSEFTAYNFTGQPVNRKTRHTMGAATQIEHYTYSYDHAGRLVETKHKLNSGAEVVLARNEYDELGRLKATIKNDKANLKTTYAYNIRSWTKSISGPLFSQTLYYNDKVTAHNYSDYTPAYNGNISGIEWKTETEALRSYRFKYDKLSRLANAAYNGMISGGDNNTSYSYDKHGNITRLIRRGKNNPSYCVVDDIALEYNGNQLKRATDSGVNIIPAASADFKDNKTPEGTIEYTYNANGAVNKDLNKGITGIQYNSLNLPQSIEIDNPNVKGRTKYMYTATGVKLQVIHETDMNLQAATVMATAPFSTQATDTKTTDYVGNKVYENGTLKRTLIDGGYIEGTTYYFFLADHLGNNRVVAKADGTVIQKNHYYPFGMAFAENTTAEQGLQPYKYNSKELDQMHGLNMYDYSARFYEPGIGRFSTVDPLAEKYYSWSPYNYSYCNPIRYIDPTGEGPGDVIRGLGQGFVGAFKSVGNAIAHPIETAGAWIDNKTRQAENRAERLKSGDIGGVALDVVGDAITTVGDAMTVGQVSLGINTIKAVSADINGGDGSATGEVIGNYVGGIAIAAGTAKMGQGVSKLVSNAGKNSGVISSSGNNFQKLLTPIDEFDTSVTIFRGTTGSEAKSSILFTTDNASVASSYVKNGGQVVKYQVSKFGLKSLEQSGKMRTNKGIHGTSNVVSTEYVFQGSDLVKYMNSIAQPIK